MQTLLSENLWEHLKGVSKKAQSRRAAVAYVTNDDYVKFTEGDLLVVDASDGAISNGQTDARILERAFKRGAQLVSYPHLHAKVLVLNGTASVGSANLSLLSAQRLTEAAWVTDDAPAADMANEFIDTLVRAGTPIDQAFIDRIKRIEVTPRKGTGFRGRRSYRRKRPHPVLIYFQEMMPGDVKKYRTESASAKTGGGARDLRVSPVKSYKRILRRMFPNRSPNRGVTTGQLTWTTASGDEDDTVVELWSPTSARANELRIARFYEIGGWEINPKQYSSERSAGHRWFYVLEMGANGHVTARLLQQQHLDLEDPLVAQHVLAQCTRATSRSAARGAIDLIKRITYPKN